jgi:hypothetical protein
MDPLIVLLATIALVQGAAGVVFEVELWPGEGRPRLVAGTATLQPRAEPSLQAVALQVARVRTGEVVEFGRTLYRTTRPGRLRASAASMVTGRRLGPVVHLSRDAYYSGQHPASSVSIAAGEMFDYLQYRAEGTCFVRVHGDVIDLDPCPRDAKGFVLETRPEIEWWVEYLVNGRSQGWLLVDGKGVKEAGRTW